MRLAGFVMVITVLMLAGCGAQDAIRSQTQTIPTQTEHAVTAKAQDKTTIPLETGSAADTVTEKENNTSDERNSTTEETMRLLIDKTEVPVTWEENASVEALRALSPLTIQMSMYGGFEQVGPIGQSITRDDKQTSTSYGDIVLYSGNQIVIFYGSNSWAYTRLGHVDLPRQEMSELLGNGDVTITLE